MPWADNHIPTYRLNRRSGRAVMTIRGRDVYLGEYGSPQSKTEYRRVIAEFLASGREDPRPAAASLTWYELAARYLRHAEGYYRTADGSPSSILMMIESVLSRLLPLYGEKPVNAFGPIALKAVRT